MEENQKNGLNTSKRLPRKNKPIQTHIKHHELKDYLKEIKKNQPQKIIIFLKKTSSYLR